MPNFSCDIKSPPVALRHFWEECVGSGHSALALRADYQEQLKRCAAELGFKRVRFHGWFLEEMNLVYTGNGQIHHSFLNADRIIDLFQSIKISPLVELSFMPKCLASGKKTVFCYRGNVTPPADRRRWQFTVNNMVKHWLDFYGLNEMRDWYFEVWNEPNWPPFWTGTQSEYFNFYRWTEEAVKSVDATLQVGGPATAQNGWISEFLHFCERRKVPLDFVSTHHYPNDPPLDKAAPDTAGQLAAGRRSQLRDEMRDIRRMVSKPLFYTEWNTSSDSHDAMHDQSYAAAFIIKTILEANGLVDLYSFWVFSDIFVEQSFDSRPFHGGFGLMTVHGVPKPAYRAFQLLHELGNQLLAGDGIHPTVDAWFIGDAKKLTVMLTNYALPAHAIAHERVQIKIRQTARPAAISAQRIDDGHANPRRAWQEMGEPEYLKPAHVSRLENASLLRREKIPYSYSGNAVEFAINLPPQGVAAVTLEFNK